MSLQHLKDLGEQILKNAEISPLTNEIALMSLESIHSLLVNTDKNHDDLNQNRQSNASNIYVDNHSSMGYTNAFQGFSFEDPIVPVVAPNFNNELINQASSIPFLYHQMTE